MNIVIIVMACIVGAFIVFDFRRQRAFRALVADIHAQSDAERAESERMMQSLRDTITWQANRIAALEQSQPATETPHTNKIVEWSEDGNHRVIEEVPCDQFHRISEKEKAALADSSRGVIWWHGNAERGTEAP